MLQAIRIRKAVVDTSPLLNLLALNFARETDPKRANDLLSGDAKEYLHDQPENQARFLELFDSVQNLATTSHVIGEVQGLSGSHRFKFHNDADKKSFWKTSILYLAKRNLDERLIRLLELSRENAFNHLIGIIGPTDSGLIRLTQLEGSTLLTDDDRTLYTMAFQQGVNCELVKNLMSAV